MGLVRLPASDLGNVPGGLGTTGPAALWAQLLPMAGATPSLFSSVAVPNTWLLCLGQGDPSMIPSGLQVGAG